MTIYTVSACVNYEGCNEPHMAFATREAAQAYVDALPARAEALEAALDAWDWASDAPSPAEGPEFRDICRYADGYVITELEVR